MALTDGVCFQAAAAGTGSFTFGLARPSYLTLAQAVAAEELVNGQAVTYVAVDSLSLPTQREWGIGTFNSAGSGSITRSVVLGTVNLGASGAGAALNFSVAPIVFLTALTPDIQPTFFVDNATGSDNAAGTSPTAAWASVAKVNGYNFPPGAQILFKGGETFNGALVAPNGGAPGDPLTFGSFGGGQATINSGASNGFTATNLGGIVVRDLTFTGTASTNVGILFTNGLAGNVHLQNVQAINCNVSGYGLHGILVTGTAGQAGYDDVVIEGCTESNCCTVANGGKTTAGISVNAFFAGYGIAGGASFNNVLIANCTAHDNTGATDSNFTGCGILMAETNNGLISNCTAYNNGANSSSAGGTSGIALFDNTNCNVKNCLSRNNLDGSHANGAGIDIDGGCSNCSATGNYTHDNAGPGCLIQSYSGAPIGPNDRSSLINNVSENDGGGASATLTGGITLNSGASAILTNARLHGNKIYQSKLTAQGIRVSGANAAAVTGLVANNSITVVGSIPHVSNGANSAGLTFNGNRYIGAFNVIWNGVTYNSVLAWNAAFLTQEVAIAIYPPLAAPPAAPTITVTTPGHVTNNEAPVHPFVGVTIADTNAGATDSLTISLSGSGTTGTLSGAGLSGGTSGVYTLGSAPPATLSSTLAALTFTPNVGGPGSSTVTTFTLLATSSTGTNASNSAIRVTDNDTAVSPTITVTTPGHTTSNEAAVQPFVGVTIGDNNVGATDSMTITLSPSAGATGTLSGSGLSGGAGGVYALGAAPPASLSSTLAALTFTPHAGAVGSSTTTTFTLLATSSTGTNASNNTVTVTDNTAATPYPFTGPAVNSFPSITTLPNPFVMNDGTPITTKALWTQHRTELIERFEFYVFGHAPAPVPVSVVSFTDSIVTATGGGTMTKRVVNLAAACPGGSSPAGPLNFFMNLYIPTSGAPRFPGPYPILVGGEAGFSPVADPPSASEDCSIGVDNVHTLVARGFIIAEFSRDQFSADIGDIPNIFAAPVYTLFPYDAAGLTGYDWGMHRAHAWGFSRCIDYLATLSFVDQNKICIAGHSRGGVACSIAGAFDTRVAITCPNQLGLSTFRYVDDTTGPGGAAVTLDQQVSQFGAPGWYNQRLHSYVGNSTSQSGSTLLLTGPVDQMPVDMHELYALCAPRGFVITEGLNATGESPEATTQQLIAAQTVWTALGVGTSNTGVFYSNINTYGSFGGHEFTNLYWKSFVDFMDFVFFGTALPANNPPPANPSASRAIPYSPLTQPWSWSTPNLSSTTFPFTGTEPVSLPQILQLPNLFLLNDNTPVTTKVQWQQQRRAQLKELLQFYYWGHLPPSSTVTVVSTTDTTITTPGVGTMLQRLVHLKTGPSGGLPFVVQMYIPQNSGPGPFPVIISGEMGFSPLIGNPASGNINGASPGQTTLNTLVNMGFIIAEYNRDNFSWDLGDLAPSNDDTIFTTAPTGASSSLYQMLPFDRNSGPVVAIPNVTNGLNAPPHGLGGQTGYEWGVQAAWVWGGMRAVDFLVSLSYVDPNKIATTGISRGSVIGLVLAALDERVAAGLPNQGLGLFGARNQEADGFLNWGGNPITPSGYMHQYFAPRVGMFQGGTPVAPLGGRGNTATIPGNGARFPFDGHSLMALIAPRGFYNCEPLFWAQGSPCGAAQNFLGGQQAWIALGSPATRTYTRYTDVDTVANGEHEMTQTHWTAMVNYCQWLYFGTPLPADNFSAGSRSIWCSSPADFTNKFSGSPVFGGTPQAYTWSTPILT